MNAYETATQTIVELLQKNENPWLKPWVSRNLPNQKNLDSQRAYTGLNALLLSIQNQSTDYWLTFKQIESYGFTIRKGEKSAIVVGWFKRTSQTETNEETGELETKYGGLACRYFRVFNVSQLDGVPETLLLKLARPEVQTFENETLEIAETTISNTQAKIRFGVEQACYRPSSDEISMPDRNRFPKISEFYSTMFHELGHWTGHSSRLARKQTGLVNSGSQTYSQEELCAEMTSVYVCSALQISSESALRNSVAYLQSWLRFLTANPKAFVIACQQAQKAANLILGKANESETK